MNKDEEVSLDLAEQKQNCPLCQQPATYKMRKLGKAKLFSCPRCISYALYIDAEKELTKIPEHYKKAYSRYAKESDENKILVIQVQRTMAIIDTFLGPVPVDYTAPSRYYKPRSNWF